MKCVGRDKILFLLKRTTYWSIVCVLYFIVYFFLAKTVRSMFTYSAGQIHELEARANDNPNDADVQAEYLKVREQIY